MFTKENLNDLYCVKGLTMEKIATQNNCTSGNVLYWIHKFGLPIKKREDYALPYHKKNIEKKDIIRFYYIEHLSTRNAAAKLGVSQCTFCRYLKQYGLSTRTLSESHAYRTKYKPRFCP